MRPRLLAYVTFDGRLLAACFEKNTEEVVYHDFKFKEKEKQKFVIRQVPTHIAEWLINFAEDQESVFEDGYSAWEYIKRCGFRKFELEREI